MVFILQQRGFWDFLRGNFGDNIGIGFWFVYLYDFDYYIFWGYIIIMYFFLWVKSAYSMYDLIIVMDFYLKFSICKGLILKVLFKYFGILK